MLLDHTGHVKLCDFGFAVRGGAKCHAKDGFINDVCGTAMYVAPEIAIGKASSFHGYPVDWWALGCVVFEMVTGTHQYIYLCVLGKISA